MEATGVFGPSPGRLLFRGRERQQQEIAQSERRIAAQQANIERQQSDLAGRTAGSLRARRGRGSAFLLGGEDQSTLG